ncbi:MAG: hypothetical protein AB3N14_09745 [Flavobacteriaceae bacterium]
MKMVKCLVVGIFNLLAISAIAEDATQFSVRGVSPGMNPINACASLTDEFPDEFGLRKKVGIDRRSQDWMFSVDWFIRENNSNANGCKGSFKGYDKAGADGAMTWADNIEIKGKNGLVSSVKNIQTIAVGNTIQDCQQRRQSMIDGLVKKYGNPTYTHDKDRKKDYRHLIWDYSSTPSARFGDDEYELYQFYAECSMYTHGVEFSLMKIQTEVHSGQVIQQARKQVKIKRTFRPNL